MTKLLKFFLCFCAYLLMAGGLQAEEVTEDVSANLGAIRGRIVDEAKHTLPGASIWISSLQEGAVSDVDGYYSLSNLNPGTYTLEVTYVGFAPKEVLVEVVAGKTTSLDIVLHEGIQLNEVSVVGAFRGQRRALNAQKNEVGIVDVVSSDQIGKFPDANIGDALKRISGINVQYASDPYWGEKAAHFYYLLDAHQDFADAQSIEIQTFPVEKKIPVLDVNNPKTMLYVYEPGDMASFVIQDQITIDHEEYVVVASEMPVSNGQIDPQTPYDHAQGLILKKDMVY